MGFWNFIKAYPQLVAVLIAFAVPTLARILKKLAEQAQKREAALRRERERLEQLRTGRVAEPQAAEPAPSARATLEEMAAKRRAQIEELRRRRQAQVSGGPTVLTTSTVRQAPAQARGPSAARTWGIPSPAAGRSEPVPSAEQRDRLLARQQAEARNRAQKDQARRERERTRQEQQQRVIDQSRDRAPKMTRQAAVAAAAAAVATPEAAATAKVEAAAIIAVARPLRRKITPTKDDLRRAIIMQEVLAPPLGLRT
jgi:hypothetical protein